MAPDRPASPFAIWTAGAVAFALAAGALAQQVFRYEDASGRVVYSAEGGR